MDGGSDDATGRLWFTTNNKLDIQTKGRNVVGFAIFSDRGT